MKALLILSILVALPVFAQASTDDKTNVAETLWMKDLEKGVNEKQQKAKALITMVAGLSHERAKEDAEYAHIGFVARLQGIREEREELSRKEVQADYATLQNYSKRLDTLISDTQAFLK